MKKQYLAKILENILRATVGVTAINAVGCGASAVAPGYALDAQTQPDANDAADTHTQPDQNLCSPVTDVSNFCVPTVTFPCNRPGDITESGAQNSAVCQRYCPTPGGGQIFACNTVTTGVSTVLYCTYCIEGTSDFC